MGEASPRRNSWGWGDQEEAGIETAWEQNGRNGYNIEDIDSIENKTRHKDKRFEWEIFTVWTMLRKDTNVGDGASEENKH